MAEDISLLSMIAMPGTSWNLSSTFLDDRVIHDKKEHAMGFNPQAMEELFQSGLGHLLHSPDVLSEESGEAGQRPMKKRKTKGLDHRGGMGFFTQLDKTDDKGREEFEGRS